MGALIVRPARREDLDRFPGDRPVETLIAKVGEIDGRVVGIGGLARRDGRWTAFVDLTPEGRRHIFAIARAARALLDEARASGRQVVYATPDPNEPNARRWLARLGFRPTPWNKDIMQWEA